MKQVMIGFTSAVLLLAAAGCTTMGTGSGSTATGSDAVQFSWTSSDAVSGQMTATFTTSGTTYQGQFFQITNETTVDSLGPLWGGWGPGWRGGRFGAGWDAGPDFVKKYTGRVVANLSAADGSHMRCRFHLIHPESGMPGGGSGECQTPAGKTIVANFPAN
jgi:hypothetical protein